MSFYALCIVASIAASLLGMGWLFFGKAMIRRWESEPNDIALVLGRRIGAVYTGLALLFFLLRNITTPKTVHDISLSVVVIMVMLATLGIYEFRNKRVGPAILLSVALEIFLLGAFGWLLFS